MLSPAIHDATYLGEGTEDKFVVEVRIPTLLVLYSGSSLQISVARYIGAPWIGHLTIRRLAFAMWTFERFSAMSPAALR